MAYKSPEDQLEELLAPLPCWHRKLLQLNFSLSPEEIAAWQQSDDWWQIPNEVNDRYIELLERCPEKWSEHCERRKNLALSDVPRARRGRRETPPDQLARILALNERGANYDQIARLLGLTKDAVRKRLKAARRRIPHKS